MSHPDARETARVTRSSTNPRRRLRTSENDTLKTSAPRRKRSKISQDVFQPLESTEKPDIIVDVDVDAESQSNTGHESGPRIHNNTSSKANGYSSHHHHHVATTTSTMEMEVPVRGKKMAAKRAMRGDGATVMAQNKCYSVRLLPSTPPQLRQEGLEYRGSIDGHGRALAVTREQAIIWEYNSHAASTPKTFAMPFRLTAREDLPFGALVPSGGVSSTDAGLVLISATAGKIFFYESIDTAASIGRFQERNNAVDGAVGLYSGEKVVDLVSADHAGFIILLDSGRTALLTLRDAQGKPKVAVNFLRVTEQASGSFFGSFKGLLTSDYKKDVAAVHTRALKARGQMQAVSLTEGGEILTWELDWSGRSEYQATAQIRDRIVTELRVLEIPELEGRVEKVTALDFALLDKPIAGDGLEIATVGGAEQQQPLHLLVLLRIGGRSMQNYAVAALTICGAEVEVHHINYISKYHGHPQRRPKIVVPKPEHSVFVVFEDATILLATREPPIDSPEAQLSSSYYQPQPFEESIYLRQGKNLAAQSFSAESTKGASQASCIFFVKSSGVVRYSAVDANSLPGASPTISAKSQIEQAVFYGTLQPENIIDFSTTNHDRRAPMLEVEQAALEISDAIVRADVPAQYLSFIQYSPTSMEQHLAGKARALKALAAYLRRNYPGLSHRTSWLLLADAERVAVGQQLWTTFEEHVASTSTGSKRKATLLDEVCTWFTDPDSFSQRPELSGEDDVRRFFIGGLHHLERLLGHVKVLMAALKSEDDRTPGQILRLALQVNDVWNMTLSTAFAYRGENAGDYGIPLEHLSDGILTKPAAYDDLPEFWTSTPKLIRDTTVVADSARQLAMKFFEDRDVLGTEGEEMAADLARANPELCRVFCLEVEEACRLSDDPQLKEGYIRLRYDQLRDLASVGQADAGMDLAEKCGDLACVAEMVCAEDQYLVLNTIESAANADAIRKASAKLKSRIRALFGRYGDVWGDVFFDTLFSSGNEGGKLGRCWVDWSDEVGRWLKKGDEDEQYWKARLCWINDVVADANFAHARKVLKRDALTCEESLWSRRVELSLGKLAALAAAEGEEEDEVRGGPVLRPSEHDLIKQDRGADKDLEQLESALRLTTYQTTLYNHIYPTVRGSLDKEAEIINVMQRFGGEQHTRVLREILENGMAKVIDQEALRIDELVDVLTLMTHTGDDSDEQNGIPPGGEFFTALMAVDAAAKLPALSADGPSTSKVLVERIWKRVFIHDDWHALSKNIHRKKSDADRLDVLRTTAVWETIEHCLRTDFFEVGDGVVRRVVKPEDVLGSGCSEVDFSGIGVDIGEMVREARVQDEVLAGYVGDCGLGDIFEEVLRGVQEEMRVEEKMNGHANGNGHVKEGAEDEEMF